MMLEEKRKFSASERNSVDITDESVRCFPAAKRATVNDNGLDRSSGQLARANDPRFWPRDADFLPPSMLVNR